jgi:hypothetical protein
MYIGCCNMFVGDVLMDTTEFIMHVSALFIVIFGIYLLYLWMVF